MKLLNLMVFLTIFIGCHSVPYPLDLNYYKSIPGKTSVANPENASFERIEEQLTSTFGGTFSYFHWTQNTQTPRGRIVLAHGFLRSKENMKGWGDWLASQGYEVAIPSFIHSSLLGGNHDKNARDLTTLANHLWPSKSRVYGGFSAGGLASALAASEDLNCVGWFGLDPVDSSGLAEVPAGKIVARGLPALLIFGQASDCNAQNNFLPPWRRADSEGSAIIMAPQAVHQAFEDPYDPGAEGLCGVMDPPVAVAVVRDWLRSRLMTWLDLIGGFSPNSREPPGIF